MSCKQSMVTIDMDSGKTTSINQSFICSEKYKKQVNTQYSVEQDTKA